MPLSIGVSWKHRRRNNEDCRSRSCEALFIGSSSNFASEASYATTGGYSGWDGERVTSWRNLSEWSRDTGFIRAALASCRTAGDIQTVYSHAPHSYRMQSVVFVWTSHVDLQHHLDPGSVLRAVGERSFAFAGPAAWNSLPTSLHEICY